MAYGVKFTIPEREIGRADIEFVVKSDGKKLGTLLVSQGALEWRDAVQRKGTKITWKEIQKLAATKSGKAKVKPKAKSAPLKKATKVKKP